MRLLDRGREPLYLERQLPDDQLEAFVSFKKLAYESARPRRCQELLVVMRLNQAFDTFGQGFTQGFHPVLPLFEPIVLLPKSPELLGGQKQLLDFCPRDIPERWRRPASGI